MMEFFAHWPFSQEEFNIFFWLLVVCLIVMSTYSWFTKGRDD